MFNITIDKKELKRLNKELKEFGPLSEVIMYRAVNRTISKIRTATKKEIVKEYNAKSSDVLKSLKLKKAYKNSLTASVISTGRPFRLAKMKYTANTNPGAKGGKGASAAVMRGNAPKEIEGAFVATMKNGMVGVFVRDEKNKKKVKQLHAPGVTSMMNNEELVVADVSEDASKIFIECLENEMKKEIYVKG